MQVYDCVVSLGGDSQNQVAMADVTAAEIYVLNTIHGEGAVIKVVKRRMDKRSHKDEYARLLDRYARRAEVVEGLFGAAMRSGGKLPVSLDGDEEPEAEAPAPAKASK